MSPTHRPYLGLIYDWQGLPIGPWYLSIDPRGPDFDLSKSFPFGHQSVHLIRHVEVLPAPGRLMNYHQLETGEVIGGEGDFTWRLTRSLDLQNFKYP